MHRMRHSMICCSLTTLALAACTNRHETVMVQPISASRSGQPEGAAELIATGRKFLADEKYGLAIAQFREALRFDASSAVANNGLGIAYASIGRDDLARRHLERAIAFAPDEASYRRNFDRFAAEGATDHVAAAEMAMQAREQGQEESASAVSYHLRQDAHAPIDRAGGVDPSVMLTKAGLAKIAPEPVAAGPRLAVGQGGVSLVTKPAQPSAIMPPRIEPRAVFTFTLDRKPAAAPSVNPAPVLKRISSYEVRVTARRSSDALAEIMTRDYLAQWREQAGVAGKAPAGLTGQDAFRAAIGGARRRLADGLSIAMAKRACSRARLVSYSNYAMVPGFTQCSS